MHRATVKLADKPVSPVLLSVEADLNNSTKIANFPVGDLNAEILCAEDAIYAVLRRPKNGGLALRLVHLPLAFQTSLGQPEGEEALRLNVKSELGEYCLTAISDPEALERVRFTVTLKPSSLTQIPFVPRDLYPLDNKDDPLGTVGTVDARQRGVNAGMIYFRMEEPAFGNVLYLQDLTALNDYFRATGTIPKDVVGGAWPELGYLMPVPDAGADPTVSSLKAGEQITLSDAVLIFRHDAPPDERESARHFIQMLGAAYSMLQLPPVSYRDWIDRADRTARDLARAPAATIRHYGHLYVHPYTAAEYPDVMVQMTLITALHDWGKWLGKPLSLEARLKAGLGKFYDSELKTLRRYLPNVGDDKDADAIDSWYLYHPLLNLGILALDGDKDAEKLLLDSIDYAIKAAQHFKYKWPVQYKATDFSIIEAVAPADGRGQTDVGGIYAWVMLQAFELTDDKRYLDEARAAIDAAIGLKFDLNYQANLTAWGAAACMRLWRITNRDVYLHQSYVYLASFFNNAVIWDSQIGHAEHYETFLAVTCLQDAPYMAMYECFDTFVAFERYLNDSGPDLEPAARMLVSEYCKYALSRAWFYYPDALPPEAIAEEQRENNGYIDHKHSFPLEDLYPDGQPAGQVGQEVYGSGAAFVFATRAFHKIKDAPFLLYCDQFVRAIERTGDRALSITLDGGETRSANLRLIPLKGKGLPDTTLTTVGGEILCSDGSDGRIDYQVPASGRLILTWC